MIRLILIAVALQVACSTCAAQCGTCSIESNPYTCKSCIESSNLIYLSSCPTQSSQTKSFVVVVAIITVVHLAMLALGVGIYRQLFENIQLISLVTWRYGFEGGTFALQGTNLAMVRSNSFLDIFGYQFFVLFIILLTFCLIIVVVGKSSHHPTATLLRRKRIIFPVRIVTFIFNILLFSSLAELSTISSSTIKPFPLAFAIAGLAASVSIVVFMGVISNYRKFQVDDPHYYVLVDQMVTKRWYAKNNIFISLLVRAGIIIAFVLLFQIPEIAGIIMVVLQISYSIYFVIYIRYTKIRYFVVLALNACLVIGIIFSIYLGAISQIQSKTWHQASLSYLILYMALIVLFFVATAVEIFLRKEILMKQLKSVYERFIQCERAEEKIVINKYDENIHRERVTEFNRNLLYKASVAERKGIEMVAIRT